MKTLTLRNAIAFLLCLAIAASVLLAFAAESRDTWLGTWEGQYKQGFLDTALVVEKIDGDKASTVYKWGTSQAWGIRQPGEQKLEAKLLDDKTMQIEIPNNSGIGIWATVTYTLQDDGNVTAKYVNRYGSFYAILKKK